MDLYHSITVQSNRLMLIVNKHCVIFTIPYYADSLYKADTWEGVRLIEVSLYLITVKYPILAKF